MKHGVLISKYRNDVRYSQTKPYLMKKEPPINGPPLEGNDLYEGYCADLAKKIAEFVKFDYIILPVKDTKYGQKDEKNSSWNGMVGELVRHVSLKVQKFLFTIQ